MIEIRCDFCGAKTTKEFNHKVEIKPWYNPRVAGHVYHREFDCCEECAKAIEHRLIGIENNWLWHGKDPNRRYKNWDLSINKTEAIPKADYENRLKADLVAMFTDLLIDVEEIESREQWCDYANDNCISRYDVEDLIQKKINSLKEK